MINLYTTKKDLQAFTTPLNSCDLGLVPTMGNLHSGHLSLIEESLKENKFTLVTIFVNPKQFGPNEDFENYPRTIDQDLALISSLARSYADSNIAVFVPINPLEIYPNEFSTNINVESYLTNILCAKSRPGHFSGVTTVVYKLFQITKAGHAYFGQKDYQQFKVIEKMVTDLEIPITLKMMPIIREDSGIALSSRNQYLNSQEKDFSLNLRKTLLKIQNLIIENKIDHARNYCKETLKENFEYLEILNSKNLKEIDIETDSFIILGAIKVGLTRLIDNQLVETNAR